MPPDDQRIQYGRLVHAFIRAGWNPPRPNDRVMHSLIDAIATVQPQAKLELSPMETKVLRLMAEGLTYREMEAMLEMSHDTLRSRQKNLFRRLGVRNAAGAVGVGFRTGILT